MESGDCLNVLRPGRSTKLKDTDGQVMFKEIRKSHLKSMAHILQEFQQASGTIFSLNIILKKTYFLRFHGRATAQKPLITKSNNPARLRWSKTLQNWSVREWKHVR
ncbi:transposable element Tc1 transposase [Trichonephila clavipes]|nr:transposable element Tc1 transposase [Trichonephila clavipes]